MSAAERLHAHGSPCMTIDPATYEFYQSGAPHFSLSSAVSHSRYLDAFLDRLAAGARILELGCGAGRDSSRIIERGFHLDATDGIPAMVDKANERHDVGARLMRFDGLDADAEYDAVWAHACLLHCPRAELPGVLARIHRAIRSGGLHHASYKLGEGEGRDLLGRLGDGLGARARALDRTGDHHQFQPFDPLFG